MDSIATQKIYESLTKIPEGKVTTYGVLAKACGIKSPRQVGRILHENKHPEMYPCHRVVFADGSLSESYAFGGAKAQREKLESEGVRFIGDKVDMKLLHIIS